MIVTGYSENYWVLGGTGGYGGGLLGGTRDTGGTVGYCWVLGGTGGVLGTRGTRGTAR